MRPVLAVTLSPCRVSQFLFSLSQRGSECMSRVSVLRKLVPPRRPRRIALGPSDLFLLGCAAARLLSNLRHLSLNTFTFFAWTSLCHLSLQRMFRSFASLCSFSSFLISSTVARFLLGACPLRIQWLRVECSNDGSWRWEKLWVLFF